MRGKVENLLQLVKVIRDKYKENSSHNFNVFTILRNESDEVNLHSRFIVELLSNIEGYSSVFLEFFLKNIGLESTILDSSITVKREYKNIDIFMETKDKYIIIENKIYANDQDRQLERYYKLFKDSRKEIKIYYLTLDGKSPTDYSLGDLLCSEDSEDTEGKPLVENISYKNNVASWIEECIKEAALDPTIREVLVQYLEVVNRLSGNSKNNNLNKEIAKLLLSNSNNFKLASEITKGYEEAIYQLKLKFWNKLEKEVFKNKFLSQYEIIDLDKYTEDDIRNNKKHYGLWIPFLTLDKSRELSIMFEVNHYFYIGFLIKTSKDEWLSLKNSNSYTCIQEAIKKVLNNNSNLIEWNEQSNETYFTWFYPLPKTNYRFHCENFLKLSDENEMDTFMDNTVELASKVTKELLDELGGYKWI